MSARSSLLTRLLALFAALFALAVSSATAAAAPGVYVPPGGGIVSGRVTDATSGVGLSGVNLSFMETTTGACGGGGSTDSTGAYAAGMLPGIYRVSVSEGSGRYLAPTVPDVTVVADGTTTLDVALTLGGTITGIVRESRGGAPVEGTCPLAFVERTEAWAGVGLCSQADGVWKVVGLPTGRYTVKLWPGYQQPYPVVWARQSDTQAKATLYSVTLAGTVSAGTTKLSPAGTLTGRVTGPDGLPVPDVIVAPTGGYDGRAGWGEGLYQTRTDDQGYFTAQVPPGSYTPLFYDVAGRFAPQWSGGAVTKASATPVMVRAGKTATADAHLVAPSSLTVTMVDSTGNPFTGYAAGLVFTTSGDYIGDFDVWPGGNTSTPLPAGSFHLMADVFDADLNPVTTTWYDQATSVDGATAVTLGVGDTKSIVMTVPSP